MVKSILQYLWELHSPNLHQLFILTWSTDTMWWFVSLTYISRLSDRGKEEMVKSILQYLWLLYSPNFHQLFILTWSTDTTWWFVSLTYISRLSDQGRKNWWSLYYSVYWCYISQNLHQLLIMTWSIDATWWNVKIYPKSGNCSFLHLLPWQPIYIATKIYVLSFFVSRFIHEWGLQKFRPVFENLKLSQKNSQICIVHCIH